MTTLAKAGSGPTFGFAFFEIEGIGHHDPTAIFGHQLDGDLISGQGLALVGAYGAEDPLGVALEAHARVLEVEGFAVHVQLGRVGAEAGQEVQCHVVALHQGAGVYRCQWHQHFGAIGNQVFLLPDGTVGHQQC